MDSDTSLQDVNRCKLCEAPVPPLYCEICHIHLCKACAGEHILDESKFHIVIPTKHRQIIRITDFPECQIHTTKLCELHCEQCDIPVCVQCVSSKIHKAHYFVNRFSFLEGKRKALQADLEELGNFVYPKYKEVESSFSVQRANLKRNTEKLISDINTQGEDWHRKIDNIVRNLTEDIKNAESENLTLLKKQEDEINCCISDISQSIGELKKLLNSNNDCLLLKYKSRNAEFGRLQLPPKLVPLEFSPGKIDTVQLYEQFGFLTKERFETMKTSNKVDRFDNGYLTDDDDEDDDLYS